MALGVHSSGFIWVKLASAHDHRPRRTGNLPTCAFDVVPAIAGDAIPHAHDASQLFGIHGPCPPGGDARNAHSADGSRSLQRDNPARCSTRLTVLSDTPTLRAMRAWVSRRRRNSTITKARSGTMARGLNLGREDASHRPASPWARKRPSHFLAVGALTPCAAPAAAGRYLTLDHVLNHFLLTRKGESGILMGVHSAELLSGCGWVAPPSLSDSVRMDRNNVLKLHT